MLRRTQAGVVRAGIGAALAGVAADPGVHARGDLGTHRGTVQMAVDALVQEAVLQQCAAVRGMDLAAQAVEGRHHLGQVQPYHRLIHGVAIAQRFHRAGHRLLVGVHHHIGEGQIDIRHGDIVAGQGQVDVAGVVVQRGGQEGQRAAHAGERALHALRRAQDGVAAAWLPVTLAGDGHRVATLQRCAAAHLHAVAGAIGAQVHQVARAVLHQQAAGHRQHAEGRGRTRCQGGAVADDDVAQLAVTAQLGASAQVGQAAQAAMHVKRAGLHARGTGEAAAVARQAQQARIQLDHIARAGQHVVEQGLAIALQLQRRARCHVHRATDRTVASQHKGALFNAGTAAVAVVGMGGQRAAAGLAQCPGAGQAAAEHRIDLVGVHRGDTVQRHFNVAGEGLAGQVQGAIGNQYGGRAGALVDQAAGQVQRALRTNGQRATAAAGAGQAQRVVDRQRTAVIHRHAAVALIADGQAAHAGRTASVGHAEAAFALRALTHAHVACGQCGAVEDIQFGHRVLAHGDEAGGGGGARAGQHQHAIGHARSVPLLAQQGAALHGQRGAVGDGHRAGAGNADQQVTAVQPARILAGHRGFAAGHAAVAAQTGDAGLEAATVTHVHRAHALRAHVDLVGGKARILVGHGQHATAAHFRGHPRALGVDHLAAIKHVQEAAAFMADADAVVADPLRTGAGHGDLAGRAGQRRNEDGSAFQHAAVLDEQLAAAAMADVHAPRISPDRIHHDRGHAVDVGVVLDGQVRIAVAPRTRHIPVAIELARIAHGDRRSNRRGGAAHGQADRQGQQAGGKSTGGAGSATRCQRHCRRSLVRMGHADFPLYGQGVSAAPGRALGF